MRLWYNFSHILRQVRSDLVQSVQETKLQRPYFIPYRKTTLVFAVNSTVSVSLQSLQTVFCEWKSKCCQAAIPRQFQLSKSGEGHIRRQSLPNTVINSHGRVSTCKQSERLYSCYFLTGKICMNYRSFWASFLEYRLVTSKSAHNLIFEAGNSSENTFPSNLQLIRQDLRSEELI